MTASITAAEIEHYTQGWTDMWLSDGIPLDAVAAYIAMTRNMALMNEGLAEWIEAGRPEIIDYPDSLKIYSANAEMIEAARRLSRHRAVVPEVWMAQVSTVVDDERIMHGYDPSLVE